MHSAISQHGHDGSEASAEQMRAYHRRIGPPDNEVPGTIGFSAVVGRTADVAVAITALQVFSNGIDVKIAIRLRDADNFPQGIGVEVFGHHRGAPAADHLLLGVAYPDGRSASNVDKRPFPDPATPDDAPMLIARGGGGGQRTFDTGFWITPLPPPGDLTIVAAWTSRGITETQVVIPGRDVARGVASNVELWPWQPVEEFDEQPSEPPAPLLPEGSWFAARNEGRPQCL